MQNDQKNIKFVFEAQFDKKVSQYHIPPWVINLFFQILLKLTKKISRMDWILKLNQNKYIFIKANIE